MKQQENIICGQTCDCTNYCKMNNPIFEDNTPPQPETVEEAATIRILNGLLTINGVLCTYETKEIRADILSRSKPKSAFKLPDCYTYTLIPSESHGQVAKIGYNYAQQPEPMGGKSLQWCKDEVARLKGYPDWEIYENWVIDKSFPVDVAVLLVSAMSDAAKLYAQQSQTQWRETARELPEIGIKYIRNPDTVYTYYKVEYKNCSLDYDETICQSLYDVRNAIQVVDSALDDDSDFEPGSKPTVIITGIGMTDRQYEAWLKECQEDTEM